MLHTFIYLQIKVHRELCLVCDEQKIIDKIKVDTEL